MKCSGEAKRKYKTKREKYEANYKSNKEGIKKSQKRYYLKNKEKIQKYQNEYAKKYYQRPEVKEKARKYRKEFYYKNIEKSRAYGRKRYWIGKNKKLSTDKI